MATWLSDTFVLCRYAKSRSDAQLRGAAATSSSLASDCEPELYLNVANSTGQINPCGLVAWSFFNDSFAVYTAHLETWAAPLHSACAAALWLVRCCALWCI